MTGRACVLTISLALLGAATAPVESEERHADALLARLSYQSSYGVDWRNERASPRICFALYASGQYLITRVLEYGRQTLQGTLSEDEARRLSLMLTKLRGETNRGGVIRQGSESFSAEIVQGGKTRRFAWVDPDHARPFPEPAARLVDWLQNLRVQNASPRTSGELSDEPICPPASIKPVQPSIASLPSLCRDR